jgi:hypothetical protein
MIQSELPSTASARNLIILRIATPPDRCRDGDPFRDSRKQFKELLMLRLGDVGIGFRPRQRRGQLRQNSLRHDGLGAIQDPAKYTCFLGIWKQQPAEEYVRIQDDPFSPPDAATIRVFARSARARRPFGRRDHRRLESRQRPIRAGARILAER